MHRLLRAFDHNHMEKARYKFLIIIIITRVETNERTVTGRSKRWPPPLNSGGRLTEV